MFAPVCIPTLNRVEHLSKCVESLKACKFSEETELVIGVDCPAKDQHIKGWLDVKKYVASIEGFKKVTVIYQEKNVGVHENYRLLREYAFSKYDRMIFSEDDNVFSPCFLEYMNSALEKFKDDPEVWAICSYFQNEYIDLRNYSSNIIKIKGYYCDYGSGIWRDKFNERLQSIHIPYQRYVCNLGERLSEFKRYLSLFTLFVQIRDSYPDLDGPCDISYAVSSILNKKYYIVPTIPIVKNIGYDGSGSYCGAMDNDLYASRVITQSRDYKLVINDDFEDQKEEISQRHSAERGWREDSRGEYLCMYYRNLVPMIFDAYVKHGYVIGNVVRKYWFSERFVFRVSRRVFGKFEWPFKRLARRFSKFF